MVRLEESESGVVSPLAVLEPLYRYAAQQGEIGFCTCMERFSESERRVLDAKSNAVYGSRTHVFCLSMYTRIASEWEGSVLDH